MDLRDEIKNELLWQVNYQDVCKDILIVVKDQLDYITACVDSIFKNTTNFKLYIWNNGSDVPTTQFLQSLTTQGVEVIESVSNEGFIKPNNALAMMGKSEYFILLNSDTIVFPNWDKSLISIMQMNPDIVQTGYQGSILSDTLQGGCESYGHQIDYLCGWCMCMPRRIYNEVGLFDEQHLQFAYCEDSDLSLRLLERGHQIYASSLGLVYHFGNRTILEVAKTTDCQQSFNKNHAWIATRWSEFLSNRHKSFIWQD